MSFRSMLTLLLVGIAIWAVRPFLQDFGSCRHPRGKPHSRCEPALLAILGLAATAYCGTRLAAVVTRRVFSHSAGAR